MHELCDEMVNNYEAKSAIARNSVLDESSTLNIVSSNESHIDFVDVDDMGDFDVYAA